MVEHERRLSVYLVMVLVLGMVQCSGSARKNDPTGGGNPGGNPELVASYNPRGSVLVMVIDTSQSMQRTDRKRFNLDGARLAVAMSNRGDNVGVVRFSTAASVHLPMMTLKNSKDRNYCMKRLATVPLEGLTDFVKAIRKAKEMLDAAGARAGASVVFLTDGQPEGSDQGEQILMDEVQTFIERGWRIYTIAFTAEAAGELLAKMAVATGGAYFQEYEPEGLLNAFLTVSSDVYNFLTFTGADVTKPVEVIAGSKRLVYILIKYTKESKATLGRLKKDGENFAFTGPNVYRYPQAAGGKSFFEVTHIFDPPAGIYQAELNGKPREVAILNHPPFDIAIMKDCPKKQYWESEVVRCGIEITCPDRKVLERLRDKVTVSASFFSKRSRSEVKTIELKKRKVEGTRLFIQGGTKLSLTEQSLKETYTIKLTLRYDKWAHEKAVSINLLPDPGKMLTVYPSKVDFGPMWVDAVNISKKLSVETVFPGGYKVRLVPEGGFFDVQPRSALVTQTEGALFMIRRGPGGELKPGRVTGAIILNATTADGKMQLPEKRIELGATLVALKGNSSVDLGPVFRTETITRTLDIALEPPMPFKVIPAMARGPDQCSIRADAKPVGNDRYQYFFTVPPAAPKGTYKGRFSIVPEDTRLAPRKGEVVFEVKANPPKLAVTPSPELAVKSSRRKNGWEEREVRLKLSFYRACLVTLEISPLVAASGDSIDTAYDVRLVPKDWDGKTLDPGKEVALTYRVYVFSDLPNGTYKGEIVFKVADPDLKREVTTMLPVVLELTR